MIVTFLTSFDTCSEISFQKQKQIDEVSNFLQAKQRKLWREKALQNEAHISDVQVSFLLQASIIPYTL